MPMINPNIGQSIQQSVVYDPVTGQSRIQASVVSTPGLKRSLYDEIRQRPGFGVPFVDSYGDEGFFETGLPSKFNAVGSTVASVPVASSVPLGTSVGSAGLAQSGIGLNPVSTSGINNYI